MEDPPQTFEELLRQDRRYKFEAYEFVSLALRYGHETLGMGTAPAATAEGENEPTLSGEAMGDEPPVERHMTGQELCEAVRLYALEQFGHMAKCVLDSWGVRTTGDLGEIVFNLIRIGKMSKTDQDRREDFENVYDFDKALTVDFKAASRGSADRDR